jgi:hypothetical protein
VVLTEDPDPTPEKGEVVWTEEEIGVLLKVLEGLDKEHEELTRSAWVQYLDAVKRMYPGAKLISLSPLVVEHPQLTPERLARIPWKFLPRR